MKNQLKRGDVVQFHTPYPTKVGVRYIVQEAHYDMERPRVRIAMLDSGTAMDAHAIHICGRAGTGPRRQGGH